MGDIMSYKVKDLKAHIDYKNSICNDYLSKDIMDEFKEIKGKIDTNNYKGIVVYPTAIRWEPMQRPHHFLRVLAENGYICFFTEEDIESDYVVKEMYDNVYLVNGEEKLIPLLKDKKVIFLITYFLQYLYSKFFTNKVIWFDLLDRLEFMSWYNYYSRRIYKELINEANLVTYSSENLKHYIKNRSDSVLLPNACNVEDFITEDKRIIKELEVIKENNKPIIGYFGAIEEWFDFKLVDILDKSDKYNIVIIGRVNEKLNYSKYNYRNVYFLGPKSFNELKYLSKYFSVAMIPFIVNKLTNSVSPVKFYEYMALNLPVISTGIYEMNKYSTSVLKIVDKRNVLDSVFELLNLRDEEIINETNKIANNNTWKKRVETIIEKLVVS